MKVCLTLQEALDLGIWEELADLQGWKHHAPAEGMDRDFQFVLEFEEAEKLGIFRVREGQ